MHTSSLKVYFLWNKCIHQNWISDKGGGGGGVSWFLIYYDTGGGGVGQFLTLADKGGKGVWTPPFLADVICEQPLTVSKICFMFWHFLAVGSLQTNLVCILGELTGGGSLTVAVSVSDRWQVTRNTWHVTHETWHLTPAKWHVICDTWHQTCTNTRNTVIPPGVLIFLSWICWQMQTDGRHDCFVNQAISNPAPTTILHYVRGWI